MSYYSYPNRTYCDILKEMRECYKTCNFGAMPGLIEELQIIGNRMEARLDAQRDYFQIRDDMREAREELTNLKNELKLTKKIKELK